MTTWDEADSTPLTMEMLTSAMEAVEHAGTEPFVFIGTVRSCAFYGKHCLRWTDEQVDHWYTSNGYDPVTKQKVEEEA